MDLTQAVADAAQRASAPKKGSAINRDAYPIISEHDAPGGTARIVSRTSTGAVMVEFEPERGRLQRIDLAAIPAVGFAALTDEHRDALRDLFPEEFGEKATQEPTAN
jgi:hypothetical protein